MYIMYHAIQIYAVQESWALAKEFAISRSSRSVSQLILVKIVCDDMIAWGECVPSSHYGESTKSVLEQIRSLDGELIYPQARQLLQRKLQAGSARNALDCALWDLEAKRKRQSVARLLDIDNSNWIPTAQTIGLCGIEEASSEAKRFSNYPWLKIKINRQTKIEYILAVHEAAPQAKLLIDANEDLNIKQLETLIRGLEGLPLKAIEQPLPAGADADLERFGSPIPIIADESCHTAADISLLASKYQAINIKLDKSGGLTEALKMLTLARQNNLMVMVGCMLGTSLSIAPAALIAPQADFVDLDSPMLLKNDREGGIAYADGSLLPDSGTLWGLAN